MTFDEWLAQPCQAAGCLDRATHLQAGRRVCNAHLNHTDRATALND